MSRTLPMKELSQSSFGGFYSISLIQRLLLLAGLFSLELILFSVPLDTATLRRSAGFTFAAGDWGPLVLMSLVASSVLFATFAYLNNRSAIEELSLEIVGTRISYPYLTAH